MSLRAIVAVEENWGIGCAGRLLVHVPEDLSYFRKRTQNSIVIMGRKTLESLPNPELGLPKRENWILSTQPFKNSSASFRFFSSKEAVLQALASRPDIDAWVIGGASVYRAFLLDCEEIWVSRLNYRADSVDVYFPNLDQDPNWFLAGTEARKDETSGITFTICCYRQKIDRRENQGG